MTDALTTEAPLRELDLRSDGTLVRRNHQAVEDMTSGIRLWRLSWALGWLDIRLRYRGSTLGPLWLTISTGVMVTALGFLYSQLFKIDLKQYLPFLALSQVLWAFLATVVSDSCGTFVENEAVIRSVKMPFLVFSLRTVLRNLIVLGHNVVVFIVVFAVFKVWPGMGFVAVLPGLLIWVLDAIALTVLLGGVCARFRDIQPIVNSVMQIAFFLTPVIWKPDQLSPAHAALMWLNPFYDLLEIVRDPLLGIQIKSMTWFGAAGYSIILLALAWAFFSRARGRIAYWV